MTNPLVSSTPPPTAASSRPHVDIAQEALAFLRKQIAAAAFAVLLLAAIVATRRLDPTALPIARYDLLLVYAVAIQIVLIRLGYERIEEAKVILAFHVLATVMELFKTARGSWVYPEACWLRLAGVPLFSGFLYSAVGSYLARCWRLFAVRLEGYPARRAPIALAILIYANFFTHHFVWDARLLLFAAAAVMFRGTAIAMTIDRRERRLPLLSGFVLVALLIWVAENIGSWSAVWLYPHQMSGFRPVTLGKLGSWYLLMIVSFVLVARLHHPDDRR